MSHCRSQRLLGLVLVTLAIALASLLLGRTSAVQALAPKTPEFVSSLGGKITSVAISGTVVFAGQGYSLASFDVSDPAHIAFLSNAPLPDFALKVQISGTNAYIADGAGGLQIVDIADPLHLQWRASFASSGAASDVAIAGNRAYVAVHSSSDTALQIADVTNPAAPAPLGAFSLGHGGDYAAIAVAASTAFLGDRLGLDVIDVGDPVHPAKLGALNLTNGARHVRLTGDHVVTVGRDGPYFYLGGLELDVIDAQTPLSPTLIGSYLTSGFGGLAPALDVVGNIAYVGGVDQDVGVIDLTVPTSPTLVNSFPFSAAHIKVSGSRGFLASEEGSLQVIDLNAVPSSSLLGEFELFSKIFDVQLRSPYAFTTEYTQILRVVDTTNLESPVLLPTGPFAGYGRNVVLNGNVAYINRFNYGVDIFDIQTPYSPSLLASYNPVGHGSYTAITVGGNYAYVGELGTGLNIIDVSNPASPKNIASVGPISGSGPQAMKRVGDILYIAAGNGGLVTVNVADPYHPSILGRAGNLWAAGLDVANDLAFVSVQRDGVYVFNVSNPASPTIEGKYPTGDASLGQVLVEGKRVFVVELWNGLLVLDASSPSNPTLYKEYPNSCNANGFDVVGDYVYLACWGGGLRILNLLGTPSVGQAKTYLPLLTR